jgi:hypothetical protein
MRPSRKISRVQKKNCPKRTTEANSGRLQSFRGKNELSRVKRSAALKRAEFHIFQVQKLIIYYCMIIFYSEWASRVSVFKHGNEIQDPVLNRQCRSQVTCLPRTSRSTKGDTCPVGPHLKCSTHKDSMTLNRGRNWIQEIVNRILDRSNFSK